MGRARYRVRLAVALAATVLGSTATGCGGSGRTDMSAPSPPVVTAQAPTPAPAGPVTVVAGPPATVAATAVAITAARSTWVMPNLVGLTLRAARDRIRALTGFMITEITSHDATGADRARALDRTWRVCSQNVPPGAEISAATRIDLGAVELDEVC